MQKITIEGNHLGTNQIQIQETFQFLLKRHGSKSTMVKMTLLQHPPLSLGLRMAFETVVAKKNHFWNQTKKKMLDSVAIGVLAFHVGEDFAF